MGFFDIFKKNKEQEPAPAPTPAEVSNNGGGSVASSEFYSLASFSTSGAAVTYNSAMAVAAVYASVGLIGGAISSMPCHIYQRDGKGGRERVANPAIWYILNEEPNQKITAAVMWEYAIGSLLLQGDGFIKILRPNRYSSNVSGLEPLNPALMTVEEKGGRLVYLYRNGSTTETILAEDILHFPGIGFDGKRGMSAIKGALRNAAGTAISADEYSGAYFKHGAKADLAIVVPGKIDQDQVDTMKTNYMATRQNARAFEPVIMSHGATLQQLTLTAEDAQLIQTRKMQVEEIARIFGIPPFMIGHTEKSSSWGSGIEEMGVGFVRYTLNRLLTKIEQELNRKLFYAPDIFAEFSTAGLERGSLANRTQSYRVALGRAGEPGWITINEIRRLENLPPIEGGDTIITGAGTNEPTTN